MFMKFVTGFDVEGGLNIKTYEPHTDILKGQQKKRKRKRKVHTRHAAPNKCCRKIVIEILFPQEK